MAPVRAICFDLDNTLWDVWPVIQRAEQAMYDYLAERCPRIVAVHTVETMREARQRTATLYPQMKHDFTFLRLQALRDHARDFGYAQTLANEAFDVFMRARNEVELYEDATAALEELKSRYRLFTASNGNADLTKIGIAHFFERSVAARQVGALKPDPVIFHKAIESTGLAADEVIYVGDDPHLDVEGARAAGMRAVWVNRTQAEWPQEIEPAWRTVRNLAELAPLLEDAS
ncbi:MAG: HAD family hydrolase [Steroidobacteraceae bacterium]|jgi:putative hydrolase of the HAD superfamily|nr:HAD family hydrolase [Steroidobacteraceae bacterium]